MNYGIGSQNFAGGYQGSYQGYNSPYGNYPYGYRGGYPTSYSYLRQYNTPVSTNPYGGIGTVYPYGSKCIFFLNEKKVGISALKC